ncbi:MAG TPA: hypothetical protein PKI44_03410 [Candidatus Omnitrophota bacterium]|nr:hypothetical protein [Candidatus Omnitrophota bacterium]
MNLKKEVILSGLVAVMMAAAQFGFAEETAVAPADSGTIISGPETLSPKETDMQWAWGEVTNLDSQAKILTLKYLDYETDQEKEMDLAVDEKTTFENIKDFSELKLKDTLSIDYVTGVDNKNIAKNISYEKPDVVAVASENTAENKLPPAAALETAQPPVNAGQSAVETAVLGLEQPQVKLPAAADSSAATTVPATPPESAAVAQESAPVTQGQVQ